MSKVFFLRVRGCCHFYGGKSYSVSKEFELTMQTDVEPTTGAEIELFRDNNWRYVLTLSEVYPRKGRPSFTAEGYILVCLDLPGDNEYEPSEEYGDRRHEFMRDAPKLLREEGISFEFVK